MTVFLSTYNPNIFLNHILTVEVLLLEESFAFVTPPETEGSMYENSDPPRPAETAFGWNGFPS